jgi:gamma-glutamyl:cysteine ligase YbdK (ATP-grasp superfamily)
MAMLTPELVDQARQLRANGVGWHTVSKRTGISEYILRVEIEPQFQEHRRAQWHRNKVTRKEVIAKRAAMRARVRPNTKAPHVVTAFDRVPDEVMREREMRQAALDRRTLSQTLLGDPPIGWRALDERARR